MSKKKITSEDYGVIVLAVNALVREIELAGKADALSHLVESALELGKYCYEKQEKKETQGTAW